MSVGSEIAVYGPSELQVMAKQLVTSQLFKWIGTEQAAFTLMMLCQSEGLHPMQAVRRYHLIDGKPSMRADAMLAEFQRQGGKVAWGERTDTSVEGTFSHPSGGSVTVRWDMDQARRANLTGKNTWKSYPRQMLTARVISEGIRTVLPGVVAGIYTPEEVQDFDEPRRPPVPATASVRPATRGGTTAPPVEVEVEAIDVTPKDEAEEIEPWSVVLDREVKAINADFRNELAIANVPAEERTADFMNKWRAINGVVGELVAKGKIDVAEISKDGKPGVQDQAKAAAKLEALYLAKPRKVLATLRTYLQDRFHAALIAAGLEEAPDAPQLPAMAAEEREPGSDG